MESRDEYYRYIEYLQTQMLGSDWESFFEPSRWKDFSSQLVPRLEELSRHSFGTDGPSVTDYLDHSLVDGAPKTRFEIPTTRLIFQPALDSVREAAEKLGVLPIRPVEILTSTDPSSTPAAHPSASGNHVLFIGIGTSSYCNYWSKCVSRIVKAIPPTVGFKAISSASQLKEVFKRDPSGILLASRLALYYAVNGTMLGFGEVKDYGPFVIYRAQILDAMETFAVAHEYAHFVAEERLTEARGQLEPDKNQELELLCDQLGLSISRECGSVGSNYLSFAGIGALVSFRSIQLCESVRDLLIGTLLPNRNARRPKEDSHPAIEERIAAIKNQLRANTAEDQRDALMQFVEEYDTILLATGTIVLQAATEAALEVH